MGGISFPYHIVGVSVIFMADEIAVDSFLNLLGQSELVSDDQLVSLMAEFRGDSARWKNSREMANELVRREILPPGRRTCCCRKRIGGSAWDSTAFSGRSGREA